LQVLSVFEEVEAFEKLSAAVAHVVEAQADMPLVAAVSLHVALLNFVLRCHADRLDYVDSVLVRTPSSVMRGTTAGRGLLKMLRTTSLCHSVYFL
jgi:hypothetical protein